MKGEIMKENKKRQLIVWAAIAAVLVLVMLLVRYGRNEEMPALAFMYNDFKYNRYIIDRQGDIYYSNTEEAFRMSLDELYEKIRTGNYGGVLVKVGSTDVSEVQRQYNRFVRVVRRKGYELELVHMEVPTSGYRDYGDKEQYWYGIYEEEGELCPDTIFRTNKEYICSDKRAYKIVDWMNEVLAEYIEKQQ